MDNITEINAFLNGLRNSTSSNTDFGYALTIIFVPICCTGIGTSIILIVISSCASTQNRPSNAVLINLAMATLLIVLVVIPLAIYTSFLSVPDYAICQTTSFLTYASWCVSAFAHAVLAVDRAFAVGQLGYMKTYQQNIWLNITLIWLTWWMSFSIFVFPLFHIGGEYGYSVLMRRCSFVQVTSLAYQMTFLIFTVVVPVVIICVCYAHVIWHTTRSQRKISAQRMVRLRTSTPLPNFGRDMVRYARQKAKKMRLEMQITKAAATTSVTFLVCFVPGSLFGFGAPVLQNLPRGIFPGALLSLAFAGCAISPLLYISANADIRKQVARLFTEMYRDQGQAVAVVSDGIHLDVSMPMQSYSHEFSQASSRMSAILKEDFPIPHVRAQTI